MKAFISNPDAQPRYLGCSNWNMIFYLLKRSSWSVAFILLIDIFNIFLPLHE